MQNAIARYRPILTLCGCCDSIMANQGVVKVSLKEGIEKVLALPNAGREGVNLDDPEHLALDAAGYHYWLNDVRSLYDITLKDRGLESMHTILRAIPSIEYKTAGAYGTNKKRIPEQEGVVSFWVRRKGGK